MGSKKDRELEKEKERLEALQKTERHFLKRTYGDFFGDGGNSAGSPSGKLIFGEPEGKENPDEKSADQRRDSSGGAGAKTGTVESRIDALARRGEEIVSAVSSRKDALQRANDALREVQSLLDNPLYNGMPSVTGNGPSGGAAGRSGSAGSRENSGPFDGEIDPSLMAGSDGDLFSGLPGAGDGLIQSPAGSGGQAPAAPTAVATAGPEASEPAEKPAEPETDPMEELDGLIGLAKIKHDVRELTDFVKIQKMRGEGGLKSVPVSLHLVFTGNPGTGKTTVARILSKLYRQIGVLSKGQLVEVDRSGLVAGYVGQTALKTAKKIEEAKGGILFIDEAYALARRDDTFGQEAIDTILKAMEDNREDLIVIVAGYTGPMETFINSNPGLKSRFNKYIEFPDYTMDELMGIFDMNCRKYDYEAADEVKAQIRAILVQRRLATRENFANAREVRNLFEEVITNQARRVAAMKEPTRDDMKQILLEDLDETAETDAAKTAERAAGKAREAFAQDGEPGETPVSGALLSTAEPSTAGAGLSAQENEAAGAQTAADTEEKDEKTTEES